MPLHAMIAVCSRRPYHAPVAATSTVGSGGYATGVAKRVIAFPDVRFIHLVRESDPDRELAGLAAFARVAPGGLRYDETTIEDMHRKFRTGLDRDPVTRITELMEPTPSAAGYGTA